MKVLRTMKKVFLLLVALTLVLGVASLWAREDGTPGISGTPHDVQVITGESGLEPCAMCHSPHSGTGQYPLWNRDQGPQTYTMYNSPSYDMNDFNTGPQEPSSLCLVCHNGVFSSLVNYPGPGSHSNENYDYEMNPTFWAMLDTDLSNEHPLSFTYDPSKDNSQDNNGNDETLLGLQAGVSLHYRRDAFFFGAEARYQVTDKESFLLGRELAQT
ncbi:MAG: hypothetical protein ACWGQW_18140, partial [bacterium]